jgi:hypothetical protein
MDCWSADRLNRPGVVEARKLLQEAVPAWAPLQTPDYSEDVRHPEVDYENVQVRVEKLDAVSFNRNFSMKY